jgi:hypothetical protein
LRVEELAVEGSNATARAAVQNHYRLASRIAALLPVNLVLTHPKNFGAKNKNQRYLQSDW